MKKALNKRNSERGGAGVKFLIVLSIIILFANGAYQWIPVAYAGQSYQQEMQTAVLQGMTLPPSAGSQVDATKKRLQRAAVENSLPPDAVIEVKQFKNNLQAHVSYTKKIPVLPFGIYDYNYQFDHTATPTGFITKSFDDN